MEAAIAPGLSSGAAASIVKSASEYVEKAWSTGHTGNRNPAIFDRIVQHGTVLGIPDNLRRTCYIEAPLMRHCRSTGVAHGVIYIAYVPTAGKGKTTFCHNYYLRSNSRKGVAFCIGAEEPPYAQRMATLLKDVKGFREEDGWLKSLFSALAKQKSFLFLDDYMNTGPNDADIVFMQQLRGVTRTSHVCVLVFTRNKESADRLVNLNGMVSIVPLVKEPVIQELHLHLETAAKEVKVDWVRELHIDWTDDDLKQVLSQDPLFADIDKQDLEGRIARFLLSRQSSEARYAVNPVKLQRTLQLELTAHQDKTSPWELSCTPRTPKVAWCGSTGGGAGCQMM